MHFDRRLGVHRCVSLESCPLPDAFPRAFDAIAVSDVLENAMQLQVLLSSLVVHLKGSGVLYCDVVFADGVDESVFGHQHGHFNYYTARSLQHLADNAGLRVVSILSADDNHKSIKTVALMRQDPSDGHSNAASSSPLQMEELQDNSEAFIRFGERAAATREWLNDMLRQLYDQGHDIVVYGVEHSVFLNYMLDSRPTYKFLFAIDDRKAGAYHPGPAIAVRRISDLIHNRSYGRPLPLAVVFLRPSSAISSNDPLLAALKAAPETTRCRVGGVTFPLPATCRVPSAKWSRCAHCVVRVPAYASPPPPPQDRHGVPLLQRGDDDAVLGAAPRAHVRRGGRDRSSQHRQIRADLPRVCSEQLAAGEHDTRVFSRLGNR